MRFRAVFKVETHVEVDFDASDAKIAESVAEKLQRGEIFRLKVIDPVVERSARHDELDFVTGFAVHEANRSEKDRKISIKDAISSGKVPLLSGYDLFSYVLDV